MAMADPGTAAPDTASPDTARQRELARFAADRAADPRGYFERLRAKGPLDFHEAGDDMVQALRREDVERILRDPGTFSSVIGTLMGSEEPLIPLGVDPPKHADYRRLLDPLFSRRRMALLEPTVAAAVNAVIDSFIDKGECDYSAAIAVPVPCSTFLSLLGLPAEELLDLVRWKDILIRPASMAGSVEAGEKLQMETAISIFERFTQEIVTRRESPRDDLITFLTTAEVEGERLSDSEIVRTLFLLLTAGLDTVTVSLECIMQYLAAHPQDREMLVNEPETMDGLIEELLRWETPVQGVIRRTTRDTEIAGCPIASGTLVSPSLSSANVDDDSMTLDLRRGDIRHLTFGGGPHRCLGSHLARMELRTVIREWHRRIPEYRVQPGVTLEWNGSAIRGVDRLPLVWDVETTHS